MPSLPQLILLIALSQLLLLINLSLSDDLTSTSTVTSAIHTIDTQYEQYEENYSKEDLKWKVNLPDLPKDHLIRYLNTFPKVKNFCSNCSALLENQPALCWGFEPDCDNDLRFQTPSCPGPHPGWLSSKNAQIDTFYDQADFGYIRQQRNELDLICTPKYLTDSSLECSNYQRFCRGRNILIDFRDLVKRKGRIRYHMDVLKVGQIAGHCSLNETKLKTQMEYMSTLQSWSPELRNFVEMPKPPMSDGVCDLVVNTPTFIMKIDATYNMYHHFCDFFNLYASLFVNQSHPLAFDTNVRIIIWETYPYDSPFSETFKAFSKHPIWTLTQVQGKRVCFKNLVLPLLPRMIFGLYYNTPIIQGCQNSGLFRAFSEFILHRLAIPFEKPMWNGQLRVTFLSRRTKYRQVLNENDLIDEISANKSYSVRQISYERSLTFKDQLAITRNTDILIGMHGAGLTHLLFLPNWATIFELYNCEDPNCYKDLARLRGVNYITWQEPHLVYPADDGQHPQIGGAHAKFTNYSFDRKEFARLVGLAADNVRKHPDFQKFQTHTSSKAYVHTEMKDEL